MNQAPSFDLASMTPEQRAAALAFAQQQQAAAPPPGVHVAPAPVSPATDPALATPSAPAGPPAPPRGVDYAPGGAATTPPGPAAPQGLSVPDALALARQSGGPRTPAHFAPSARSTTMEGRAPSSEFTESQKALYGANQELAARQADAEGAVGAMGALRAKQDALYAQQKAQDDARYVQAQQAALAQDREHITSTLREASDPATDPMKWWHDKSSFSKLMTGVQMIAQGFLFGKGVGTDPTQWINQQIKMSVEQQQGDHAAKRAAADTAIQGYKFHREALGDDARARDAVELAQRTAVVARLNQYAADATAPELNRLRAATTAQQLSALNAKQIEDYWDKTADKHTSASSDVYKAAVTGGAGTPLQQLERAGKVKEAYDKLYGADPGSQKAAAELDKTRAETGKLQSDAAGGKANPKIAEMREQAGLPGAEQASQRYGELTHGGAVIPGTSLVDRARRGVAGLVGAEGLSDWVAGADSRELHGVVIPSLATAMAKSSGARATPEIIEMFTKKILGNGSREDIARGVAMAQRELRAQEANARASGSSASAGAYDAATAPTRTPPGFAAGVLDEEPR